MYPEPLLNISEKVGCPKEGSKGGEDDPLRRKGYGP